jgi:predicted small secreted protein
MKHTIMIAAAVLLSSFTAAHAGSNTCEGTVAVGKEWTTLKSDTDALGCRFQTASNLGRRILAICPDGSPCMISIPLNKPSRTLTVIDRADRLVPTKVLGPDGSVSIQNIIPLDTNGNK